MFSDMEMVSKNGCGADTYYPCIKMIRCDVHTYQIEEGGHEAVVGPFVVCALQRGEEVVRVFLPLFALSLAIFQTRLGILFAILIRLLGFALFQADDVVLLF